MSTVLKLHALGAAGSGVLAIAAPEVFGAVFPNLTSAEALHLIGRLNGTPRTHTGLACVDTRVSRRAGLDPSAAAARLPEDRVPRLPPRHRRRLRHARAHTSACTHARVCTRAREHGRARHSAARRGAARRGATPHTQRIRTTCMAGGVLAATAFFSSRAKVLARDAGRQSARLGKHLDVALSGSLCVALRCGVAWRGRGVA